MSVKVTKRKICNVLETGGEEKMKKHQTGVDKPVISSNQIAQIRKDRKKKLGRNVECTHCGKLISDRRNLNRHLRTIHGVQPKVRKVRVKCSFSDTCSFICATNTILRHHLESVHGFGIVQKQFRFNNWTEFERWKEDEEIRTCSSYVTDTGVKCRNKKKIYYLRCHRSGLIRAEQNEKKERLRSKPLRGYTQCGFTCPSSMQVVESQDGAIDICYFPKHLGHKTDDESVKYIKLRRKEKEEIAAKLVQGEPINKILCEARVNRGQNLSRVNFLRRRDIYNIKSKVTFLEKELDQDGKSIESWVNQMNPDCLNNNPIALYKPIDKENDYMLVIIHNIQKIMFSLLFDGSIVYVRTKKGKANVDFNLTAVYLINENGDGYPLAFCISSKSDYTTISALFKVIFDNVGTITAQIFISDNFNFYYIAWKNIMGECENKLICNFNIDSHWDQRLLELKCPFKKYEAVSSRLKSLLHEIDPDIFESELVRLLNSWSEDEDLKPFVKFFYKYYCKKPFEWANCYRVHSVRKENINKYLRSPHDRIESIYAEGAKGVNYALNSIFLLIRSELYTNLVKWDEDILADKIQEIERNHSAAKDITDVAFNGSQWIVRNSHGKFVVKKDENNCGKECSIVCTACDICIHDFSCFCADYLTNFNICEHIHAVIAWNLSKRVDIKYASQEKYLASSALKLSAVSLSKTITEYLEKSDLTDLRYDKIILDLDKLIKEHSLKDRFEDSCFRQLMG